MLSLHDTAIARLLASHSTTGRPRAAQYPDVTALQFPFALGYVSLIGVLMVTPSSALVAPVGVRIAHASTRRQLEIAFGLFLLAVSVRFLVSLLVHLG